MRFRLFGPFPIPTQPRRNHTNPALISQRTVLLDAKFWEERVDGDTRPLEVSASHGVYVFDARYRNGTAKPWYVGLTENGFRTRISSPDERANLNELLIDMKDPRVILRLWLYARITETGQIARGTCPRGSVNVLENMVIAQAYARNPNLLNTHGKAMLRDLKIEGWPRAGDPRGRKADAVAEFREMMGIE